MHHDQQEVNPIRDLTNTMGDLITSTGGHLTAKEFLKVDAEEHVILEMSTKKIVQLMKNDWLEPTMKENMTT
jgi:hypothetical protein